MEQNLLPLTAMYLAAIILTVVSSTYLVAKAKKTTIFKWFMLMQIGFLLWLFGSYIALLAPAVFLRQGYAAIQFVGMVLVILGCG